MPHRRDEFDQFHAGRGLVAGTERIDDAELLGLSLEIRANCDVGFDIHHDEVLTALHRVEAKLRANFRDAGRVDHHVDQAAFEDVRRLVRHRDLTGLDRRVQLVRGLDLALMAFFLIGDLDRAGGRPWPHLRNRRDFDAVHVGATGDNIGPHFTGADEADADRLAAVGAPGEVSRQACQGDIRGHGSAFQVRSDRNAVSEHLI